MAVANRNAIRRWRLASPRIGTKMSILADEPLLSRSFGRFDVDRLVNPHLQVVPRDDCTRREARTFPDR